MSDEQIYEKFLCAPGMRLQAHEKISAIHHENLVSQLERIEEMMERLEKRLWLTVFGVVAVILAKVVEGLLVVAP